MFRVKKKVGVYGFLSLQVYRRVQCNLGTQLVGFKD